MAYIITAEPKELFNFKNERLGMSEKRALFYSSQIGRKRIYRNNLNKPNKGLKILSFKRLENAERICNKINEAYNDTFKVETSHANV